MITTEFKLVQEAGNPFGAVLEMRYDGELIGTIYPSLGPGFRVASKRLTGKNIEGVSLLPLPGESVMEVPLMDVEPSANGVDDRQRG